MKRLLSFLFALFCLFLFPSCSVTNEQSRERIAGGVLREKELLITCAEAMAALGEERIYAGMETVDREAEESEDNPKRLVTFTKESGDRTPWENEAAEQVFQRFGIKRIFYQTSSDRRHSVIFSFEKENFDGKVVGFYYSFDGEPVAWWGRRGNLYRKGELYLQSNENESALYSTGKITDHFYYFEKEGDLVA